MYMTLKNSFYYSLIAHYFVKFFVKYTVKEGF
jgi:hypothetical protein